MMLIHTNKQHHFVRHMTNSVTVNTVIKLPALQLYLCILINWYEVHINIRGSHLVKIVTQFVLLLIIKKHVNKNILQNYKRYMYNVTFC